MKAVNNQDKHYDLLVIPQGGHLFPAPHLTPDQAQQVQQNWFEYALNCSKHFEQTWQVAIAHINGDTLTITTQMDIPRMPIAKAA